jgi:ankyrin repeat protein
MDSTQFLRLIRHGDLNTIQLALANQPELASAKGPHPSWGGHPQPLHVAVETRQLPVVDLLLAHGADPNGAAADYDHWTPLMLAVSHDDLRQKLIDHGATIGVAEALLMGLDDKLPNALPETVPNGGSWLAHARTTRAIDHLIALGASKTIADRWGVTPMMTFSKHSLELAEHLWRQHAVEPSREDLARLNNRACAPASPAEDEVIFAAVAKGHRDLVQWLLTERQANPNARTAIRSRQTLLHEAAWQGDLAMVKLLLQAGADPAARDEEHNATALEWAETAIQVRHHEPCRAVAAHLEQLAN